MEFFNKKEDVLDFKLTEYGKYLLALGRLKPAYYCFFDDDILYDVSAHAGAAAATIMTEPQNMAEVRIQNDTPSLRVIPTRTSAEKRVNSFVQQVSELLGPNSDPANNVDVFSKVEVFQDKGKVNAHPIGRSSITSRYDAAWSVEILSTPQISSSVVYMDDGGFIENTPQLNINLNYNMYFSEDVPGGNVQTIALPGTDLFLSIEKDFLVLEVMESNTEFEKENFEIEVYHSGSMILPAVPPNAPAGAAAIPPLHSEGTYTQLSYAASTSALDLELLPIQNDLNIPGNVEYYINVLVDEQIPEEVLNSIGISEKAIVTNSSRLRLNQDIYTTEEEEPC